MRSPLKQSRQEIDKGNTRAPGKNLQRAEKKPRVTGHSGVVDGQARIKPISDAAKQILGVAKVAVSETSGNIEMHKNSTDGFSHATQLPASEQSTSDTLHGLSRIVPKVKPK